MSLREDLIAAKALIDTPEKLADVGSVREACRRASTYGDSGSGAFGAFMSQPGDERFVLERGSSYVRVEFESLMDRFDRAIAAAEPTP